ncbi:MAG TPA: cellulose binding domain-containing protein [Candidatus Limnocylindrales bacterium]
MDISRRGRHALMAGLAALTAGVLLASLQLGARALSSFETPNPVTGNTTYFDGLGSPYGGCGLPQANLDTQNFIALNVYDTPGDYAFYPRPVTGPNLSKRGMWNNGLNCGRWVRVTVSDFCTGINDGAPGQAFCRNGSWVADSFNGATLDMVVADSCGDANAWCRDDPYHIDLSKASLSLFSRNGTPAGSMLPNNYNNRRMTWQFIPAPNYTGDITIGFLSGAQVWWPAIAVNHLANGIHGVEYLQNGVWVSAQMNSDMGQSYIIGGTSQGGNQFQIRVRNAADQLINNGRVYHFTLPSSCGSSCGPAYTQVSYTTSGGSTASPSVPASPSPSRSVSPSPSPSVSPSAGGRSCTASYAVVGQWGGGFQTTVTVRNSGPAPLTGWRVNWTFTAGQTITSLWDGVRGGTLPEVVVTNMGYNGSVGVNGSTTFGFLGTWNNSSNPVPPLTCTAS